ncbi:MAG: SDR family oxidoreductase [Chloroflexi bacterium]|nr:SDR family oxidoreductase [Chloroflexota bacterium]
MLVPMLVERGYRVRVADRFYWGTAPLAPVLDRIELVHADVRDLPADVFDGVDAVMHLSGLSNDPTAEWAPEANWQMNAVATERLAESCRRAGVRRLTFGSSCSVYDGLPPGRTYDENAEVAPRGAYATSKKYGEEALLAAAGPDFCPVLLRQATVYGFSPRMRYDLVVNTFLKDALSRGKLSLHGGGWMWRPLVDVRDVARAHIACLEAPEEKVRGEIFNVVHDNYQIRQLAMLVAGSAQLFGHTVALDEAPLPSLVRDYRCSAQKLRDRLGFEATITPLESIADMLGRVTEAGYADFNHPRFYNIAWMTLLADVQPHLAPFPSVI